MRAPALAILLAVGLLAPWAFLSSAQVDDAGACEQACREVKASCIDVCGTHADPVECEAQCDDELEGCLERCR